VTRREHGCWTNFETIPRPYVIHHVSSCFMSISWVFHSISQRLQPVQPRCTCQSTRGKAKKRRSWGKSKSRVPSCNRRPSTMREGSQKNSFQSCRKKRILQMCNRLIDINEININWHDLISYILQKLLPPSHYKSIQKLSHKLRKRSGALGAGYRTQHTLKSKICLMSEEISGNRRKHNETYGEMQGYLNISQ